MSRFHLVITLLVYLFFASPSYAAFNDVILNNNARIDVGVYTITVYSNDASLASLSVNDSSFSLSLSAGSSLALRSSDRVAFQHNADTQFVAHELCSDTESGITFSSVAQDVTITVTPTGICTNPRQLTGGGRSSTHRQSEGGQSLQPKNQHEELIAQLRSLVEAFIIQGGSPSSELLALVGFPNGIYIRDLDLGSQGGDVKALQMFLITTGVGKHAVALGAVGATGYFGVLTQQALAEFQEHAGITPSQGYFGIRTRSLIASL